MDWEYVPLVGPRPPRGFVGLKNAGATCYMNSVLQQLFMIEPIRNGILAVEGAADNVEEEMLIIEKENSMSMGNNDKENPTVSILIWPTDFTRVIILKQNKCVMKVSREKEQHLLKCFNFELKFSCVDLVRSLKLLTRWRVRIKTKKVVMDKHKQKMMKGSRITWVFSDKFK